MKEMFGVAFKLDFGWYMSPEVYDTLDRAVAEARHRAVFYPNGGYEGYAVRDWRIVTLPVLMTKEQSHKEVKP